MKKYTLTILTLLLFTFCLSAQTPIGSDLVGDTDDDQFGNAVSISADGSRIAVGAPLFLNGDADIVGYVKVFDLVNGEWEQVGSTVFGSGPSDFFGNALELSADGNVLAINGIANTNAPIPGQVVVYEWSGTDWVQKGSTILGKNNGDQFGQYLALSADGNHLIAGAVQNDDAGDAAGQARVYAFENGDWTQRGADLNGKEAGDFFGIAVDISNDGNRIAIGASNAASNAPFDGEVISYEWINDAWAPMGNPIAGAMSGDLFGISVALSADGSRIAAGALNNDGAGELAGHVRVFDFTNGDWQQVGAEINGTQTTGWFGVTVSLSDDGNRLAVGAPLTDVTTENEGAFRVYDLVNNNWLPLGMSIEGEMTGEWLGYDVVLSADGNQLIASLRSNPIDGPARGKARVYDLSMATDVSDIAIVPLAIYPNPSTDWLYPTIDQPSTATITNQQAQVVKRMVILPGQAIAVQELAAGAYQLVLETKEEILVGRFVKVGY